MADERALIGSWTHSHEEDHDDVQVYRPGDAELPPSRGRTSFTLRPDATAAAGLPGPTDSGLRTDDGTWSLAGDVLHVDCPGWGATYEVVAADPDRLELRPT
jgi:hypothetical protein